MQRLEVFSTIGCACGRLAYCNRLAASTLGPVKIDTADTDFDATLKRIRLRDLEIVTPSSPPATIRTGGLGRTSGMLNLQVQLRGTSSTLVGDRTSHLDCGDFMLFDPSATSLQRFVEPTTVVIVRLPTAGAAARAPILRSMLGVPVNGASGAGAVLSQFIRTTWDQIERDANIDWADSLCEVIWPLIDMVYASVRHAPLPLGRVERLRREILRFTDHHFLDPDLTATRIATTLDISARYVQMAFARMGTTPSAYVRAKRLDHAAKRLAAQHNDTSITEIAFDSGFEELSTFCRLFRGRFGVSPREYRAGMRQRPLQE